MRLQLVLTALLLTPSAYGQWSPVSDFESAALGTVNGQEGWTTAGAGDGVDFMYDVVADPSDPSNQVLSVSGFASDANAYVPLGASSIGVGETGTMFFRVRATDLSDMGFGATDNPAPTGWADFQGYMVMGFAGPDNQFKIRDNGTNANAGPYVGDTWYNAWVVFDNDANTNALYVSQGADDAMLLGSGGFRNQINDPSLDLVALNIRMGRLHGDNQAVSYLDDIYVSAGVNLTNPVIPEPTAAALALIVCGMAAARRRS